MDIVRRGHAQIGATLGCILIGLLACEGAAPPDRAASPATPRTPDAVAASTAAGDSNKATTTPADPTTPAAEAPSEAVPDPTTPAEVAPAEGQPFATDEAGALALVDGLRQALQNDPAPWLARFGAFPFDVDGAVLARDLPSLQVALDKEHPDLGESLQLRQTCQARTRAQLLEGAPWHFIDRLGQRPPAEALALDLDRMGVGDNEWVINCHHGDEAGIFLIVAPRDGEARLRSLRR